MIQPYLLPQSIPSHLIQLHVIIDIYLICFFFCLYLFIYYFLCLFYILYLFLLFQMSLPIYFVLLFFLAGTTVAVKTDNETNTEQTPPSTDEKPEEGATSTEFGSCAFCGVALKSVLLFLVFVFSLYYLFSLLFVVCFFIFFCLYVLFSLSFFLNVYFI
jgi:hypothetical protein